MSFPRRSFLVAAVAGAATSLLAACGGDDAHPSKNLLETAQADPQFSLLVEALSAAKLTSTLSGAGPYTVFAPTDNAFAALLTELGLTKAALLADTALLTAVLTYHVLAGRVEATTVSNQLGKSITTVQGGVFKVENRSGLKITDGRNRQAAITATDLQASNGVIHVIDKVLLPANKNLVETAQSVSDFSILVEAVVAAGLVPTLSGTGPFTVFAPTNAAFAAALTELGLSKDQLLASHQLGDILKYHVLNARVLKAEVPVATPITTVQGAVLTVDASLAITDKLGRKANIISTDVLASNGVIHVIDKVILPAGLG